MGGTARSWVSVICETVRFHYLFSGVTRKRFTVCSSALMSMGLERCSSIPASLAFTASTSSSVKELGSSQPCFRSRILFIGDAIAILTHPTGTPTLAICPHGLCADFSIKVALLFYHYVKNVSSWFWPSCNNLKEFELFGDVSVLVQHPPFRRLKAPLGLLLLRKRWFFEENK